MFYVLAHLAGATAVLGGAAVLVGWAFNVEILISVVPGLPHMVPNTAVALLLLGASLGLQLRRRVAARRVGQLLAALVVVFAALTLAEYLAGWDFHIDELLFPGARSMTTAAPGRPSLYTAANLLGLGLALLLLDVRLGSGFRPAEALALAAILAALLIVAGYFYGAEAFYVPSRDLPRTGSALHTALLLIVLGLGVLWARPRAGLMAIVTSRHLGGTVARRLLVAVFAFPVLGLLAMFGHRVGLYGQPAASVLLAIVSVALAVPVVLATSRSLNRLDEERKENERELARREASFRGLVERANDAIFLADREGRYTEVNEAGCRMLGCARHEIVGKTIVDILIPEDVPRLAVARENVLSGGAEIDDWTVRRKDGTLITIEVSTNLLPDGRWLALVRDVTAVREIERLREEWTSVVAHDLRQPVAVIALSAELLARNRTPSADEKRSIECIRVGARRLRRMIDDLLDASRIEAHRLVLELEPLDLGRFVPDVVERLATVRSTHVVRVTRAGGSSRVHADPVRIEQVLGNLLSNAAKYGDPGSEIHVEIATDDEWVEVAVRNRGQVIPPDELEQLFQRFTRGTTTHRSGVPGLGLGLYISKGLIEAQGGRIWGESAGRTTTFHFSLPKHHEDRTASDPPRAPAASAPALPEGRGRSPDESPAP